MFHIHMRSVDGKYHQPISMDYLEVAVELAVKYRFIAPKIMITNSLDASVLEIEQGKLIHPEPTEAPIDELESLDELNFSAEDLEYKIAMLEQLDPYTDEWNDLQASIFAVAARDNINLHMLGWEPR